jgi:uncharacterized protein
MDRGTKIHSISTHLLGKARTTTFAALAVFGSLGVASLAHAASFQCPHNASASEHLVCTTPELSAMDDRLAETYKKAYAASLDRTALEADRVAKWKWRQHNCTDKACVTDWYNRRTSELEANLAQSERDAVTLVKKNMDEQQIVPPARTAVLELKGMAPATDDKPDAGAAASPKAAVPDAKAKPSASTKTPDVALRLCDDANLSKAGNTDSASTGAASQASLVAAEAGHTAAVASPHQGERDSSQVHIPF